MEQSGQTSIYGGGLLDGTGAPAIHDAAIRLEAERIKRVRAVFQSGRRVV